jgi:hypothetical protein
VLLPFSKCRLAWHILFLKPVGYGQITSTPTAIATAACSPTATAAKQMLMHAAQQSRSLGLVARSSLNRQSNPNHAHHRTAFGPR